ncbi:MAG: cytochrome c oxidase subunit II [Phycisphaerales bacterium]|nr:cytochrome c oxidase subunit II [Phycisphaerales bacterium]
MDTSFRLLPETASTMASQVDGLYFFLNAVAAFFALLIFVLIVYFSLRYRRRDESVRPAPVPTNLKLELLWTIIPFLITMVLFSWSARLFIQMSHSPADAMRINVVGKQWMWKIQHPDGQREINALHVPVGKPIELMMTSQDVIHSFYVPAFRIKQDVLPGSYSRLAFTPTKVGEYHLFCAEFCGDQHSGMIGKVVVMEPAKYDAWLAGTIPDEPPALAGERLFAQYGCMACHGQRGPTMAGLFGRKVELNDGTTVTADEQYLHESIFDPAAKIVRGFTPLMPSFRGQLTEEQVMQLIAYIKSLQYSQSTQEQQ